MFRSLILLTLPVFMAVAQEPLIVHEWGTITTHHAVDGTPKGHLNRIEASDVLPAFVHRYEPPATRGNPAGECIKSPLVPGRPDVNMRLETPVIYFYPPKGFNFDAAFDVSVKFRGGILNEFYPPGVAGVAVDNERINSKMAAGVIKKWDGKILDDYVIGSLDWNSVRVAEKVTPPDTGSDAWLAPRRVKAAGVRVSSGETEKYLFYRGVAHLDALVQTAATPTEVTLKAPEKLHWLAGDSMTIPKLWVAELRKDGAFAFREREGVIISKTNPSGAIGTIPLFSESDYSNENLENLRRSMKTALIGAGLYEDEAEAMLTTWRKSYFETPGLRVFYIVPREWTDYFLPLSISVPNQMMRVLVGRIDILRP